MFEAARVTDPIAHSHALTGFLIGAVIGIALIAAVAFCTVTCGAGAMLLAAIVAGMAAAGAASMILSAGEAIGKMFTSPTGSIRSGSRNVSVNDLAAAFATGSTVVCDKHNPVQLVAEGSANVFINDRPAARKRDAIMCGARIDDGSPNVFIGGGTCAYLPVEEEISPGLRKYVDWAFTLAALVGGVGGLINGASGITRAALPCAARFAANFVVGEAIGRYLLAPVAQRVIGGLVGKPVDVATGRKILLADSETDFAIHSPVPLVCSRFYASNLTREGSLGRGWVLPWDLRLQAREGKLWFTDNQGRDTGFPLLQPGQCSFSEAEQCYLKCTADGRYILYDLYEIYHDFGHVNLSDHEIAWVQRVENRCGQGYSYSRDEQGRVQAILTTSGQELQLHYDERSARLTSIACSQGGTPATLVAYAYDALGQLVRVSDANGDAVRRFSYADGLMASHTSALGFVCSYVWADIGGAARVVASSTSEGERTTFRYDCDARQTWAQDELGRRTPWRYDAFFQIVECNDFDGGSYHVAYSDAGMPERIQLPGEREVVLEYDAAGRLVGETDPLGRATRTDYDANSLRVSELTLPDGSQWRTLYDELGRPVSGADPLGRRESYEYAEGIDPLPVAHVDARGGRQQMQWNRRGQLTAWTDCSGKTTRYEYDADGELASVTDALGHLTQYRRLRGGREMKLILADGSVEEFEYDAAGLLIGHQDSARQSRRWQRNARGQVLDAIDPLKQHRRYRYDARGRLVELATDAAARYGFEYDSGDRLIKETRPDDVERHLRYDDGGALVAIETLGAMQEQQGAVRARRTTSFARDKMGRLLAQSSATACTTYEWSAVDRLTAAQQMPTQAGVALGIAASALRFEYDRAGRLLAEHGSEGTVAYGLDELDNLTSLDLPYGQRIDMLTYGSGHVHQLRAADQVVSDLERDELHREILRTQGKLTQRIDYDLRGRRSRQASATTPGAPSLGTAAFWRTYRYNRAGELERQRDGIRGELDYQYDAAGRLQSQDRGIDGHQERFAWDAAGNMLDARSSGAPGKSGGRVVGNRLMVWQDLRFAYDAWGNLRTKRKGAHLTQEFSFDGEDRLVRVRTENLQGVIETRFEYDPLGRRIAASEQGIGASGTAHVSRKRFVWQGPRMVQEVRDSAVSTYVYDPDAAFTPLARLDVSIAAAAAAAAIEQARRPARVLHFHTSVAGAPLEVTDEAGELVWAGKYQAWGKVTEGEEAVLMAGIDQPLRFPGQYADEGTGLHYNTFRFYDPDIGRFISPDPIGLDGGDNLYAYAPNPTGWSDPLGWYCGTSNNHHPIPSFMGGKRLQTLIRLTKPVHVDLHNALNRRLFKAVQKRGSGAGNSTASWDTAMKNNPGMQKKVLDATLEAAREVDLKHGTNIVAAVWDNLVHGRFKVHP